MTNPLSVVATATVFAVALLLACDTFARGGGSGGRSSGSPSRHIGPGPGTGLNSNSHSVRGYTRKDGTYVPAHRQSNPDKNFQNNWSTKGNRNPYTGKEGTRNEPPQKP